MNKEQLGKYTTYKRRVEKLQKDMEELEQRGVDTVAAKVKGSMRHHPYTERRFSVKMEIPEKKEHIRRRILKREQEVEILERCMQDIEKFIDGIDDVHIKSIFEYRYIQGMTCEEVGEKMGYTHSRISQIVSNYLNK